MLLAIVAASAHDDEPPRMKGGEQLGEVHFPTSCGAEAQRELDRAVAILHSFFYAEALKAFTRVSEIEPACAMGWWGIAMSSWHPLWYPPAREDLAQGAQAVERAQQAKASTERERQYIAAIATFYRDTDSVDHRTRVAAYEKAMEGVHRGNPNDPEAAAFYALALQAAADPNDKTYAKQLASGAILEKLYAAQPNHPGVAHYLINAYDYPELASRALEAARRYAEIAPAMPHALHMPSHTFITLGLWQDAIRANVAAEEAAKKAGWVQEELHAMDYLVYAYLQTGRERAAAKVRSQMEQLPLEDRHTLGMDYALAAADARYALELRRWPEAATLVPSPSTFAATHAVTHFARALGAARNGSAEKAESSVAKLAEIRDVLAHNKQEYWAKQVDIQRQSALAWATWARGRKDEAISLMRAAAEAEDSTYKNPVMPAYLLPTRELLADMLLESKRPEQALIEYDAALRGAPNRFNSLYGAARAAEQSGEPDKAKQYYKRLLAVCEGADSDRTELRIARQFVGQTSTAN
jgi:tetratricopeptide (TPR) repeat protein